MAGCLPGTGCCNANPDPCCGAPQSEECHVKQACEDAGEGWGLVPVDGGYREMCRVLDAGVPDLAPEPVDAAPVEDGGTAD